MRVLYYRVWGWALEREGYICKNMFKKPGEVRMCGKSLAQWRLPGHCLCLLLCSCKGGVPDCITQRSVIVLCLEGRPSITDEEVQEVDEKHARWRACRRGTCYKILRPNCRKIGSHWYSVYTLPLKQKYPTHQSKADLICFIRTAASLRGQKAS